MLELKNLTISFGGLIAVNEVSFTLEKNSIMGLIGPNGAGKTTLFNLISGVLRPTSGEILLQGKRLDGLEPYQVNEQGVARTYQNINLFSNLTVMENVKIGRHPHTKSGFLAAVLRTPAQRREEAELEEICCEFLRFMGLLDKRQMLAKNLSYGEQRRLEMARALASDPVVLLLDEPAAGMNHTEKNELIEMITAINERGITILLVEHDMPLVMELTHNIVVLNYGKKIAMGDPQTVQNDPEVISAYLGGGLDG